ncbi:hypothetical protein A2U01_0080107, partial [Trifolium medium]|nr:hypothetical protein [Trifolium medium]
ETTARYYSWMDFNSLIGESNASWVEEFYANALGRADHDYTSTVRGVEVSYAPDVTAFCEAYQRRYAPHTDQEYADMLQALALPGRDWHYD